MAATFAACGKLYSTYANAKLPWNELHAYSRKLATAPTSRVGVYGAVAANVAAPSQQSRAKLYAYRAAVMPHHIMRLPDALFGTGVHKQGSPVSITTGNEAVAHISECIRSPCDSGLVGLAQGLLLLKSVCIGAFFGALVGAAVCVGPETIDTCAATGSVLAAVMVWLSPALSLSVMNGVVRAGTSLTKFVVVGAFYGAGYAVGAFVETLVRDFSRAPASADA